MNNQYAVSIRHIYTMPDETFNGYELVLWHWDVIENTWLFRATRDYPISKRVSRGCALWKALGDAQELARIFQCKNYATNEEGMWATMTDLDDRISEYAKWIESRYDDSHELRGKGKNGYIDGKADAYESSLREFKRIFNVKEE